MKLYSKERFTNVMLSNTGNNGSILPTISINRSIRFSKIYFKCVVVGKLKPTLYRRYKDGDSLITVEQELNIIDSTTTEYIIEYDIKNDHNYIDYAIWFECLQNDCEIYISEIGVIFDSFDSTLDYNKSYSSSSNYDINMDFLDYQEYESNHNFSLICNRSVVEEVLNILDEPYYIVDVKDGCVDNSSSELISTSITTSYVTGHTKYVKLTINNLSRD